MGLFIVWGFDKARAKRRAFSNIYYCKADSLESLPLLLFAWVSAVYTYAFKDTLIWTRFDCTSHWWILLLFENLHLLCRIQKTTTVGKTIAKPSQASLKSMEMATKIMPISKWLLVKWALTLDHRIKMSNQVCTAGHGRATTQAEPPAEAPREPFNFKFYRPRQDIIKRYFIYLIVFFIILVVVLALVFFIKSVLNK
jgi:hypothetical protein